MACGVIGNPDSSSVCSNIPAGLVEASTLTSPPKMGGHFLPSRKGFHCISKLPAGVSHRESACKSGLCCVSHRKDMHIHFQKCSRTPKASFSHIKCHPSLQKTFFTSRLLNQETLLF